MIAPTDAGPAATRRQALAVWSALCASTLGWLVLIHLADEGVLRLPRLGGSALLPYLLLAVAVIDVAVGLVVRAAILRASTLTERPQRALTATTIAAAIAATAATLGFVAYLFSRRAGDFYAFIVVALAGFAACFPRRSVWPR